MRAVRTSKMQAATAIYGLLYLVFVLLAWIPSTRSLIVENCRPASMGLELALAQLLFVLFLLGLTASWHSELIAGTIFFYGTLSSGGRNGFRFATAPAECGQSWVCPRRSSGSCSLFPPGGGGAREPGISRLAGSEAGG